jgi:hypothetical protein
VDWGSCGEKNKGEHLGKCSAGAPGGGAKIKVHQLCKEAYPNDQLGKTLVQPFVKITNEQGGWQQELLRWGGEKVKKTNKMDHFCESRRHGIGGAGAKLQK